MTNRSFQALALATLTAVLSLPAVAQTRYCIGGDLDHLSSSERATCAAARDQVKLAATRFGAPEDWHFVIVCGEQGWKQYTAVAERGEVALADSSADTDFSQRVTYIRESRLRSPEHHELQRVIAHEVAAAQNLTHDEAIIASRMSSWGVASRPANDVATLGAEHEEVKATAHGAGL